MIQCHRQKNPVKEFRVSVCGYKDKIIAQPDKPLQTLVMPEILKYSDDTTAEKDLKSFQRMGK